MATLIPQRSSCLNRMTSGEKRFSMRLEDKLEDDYVCWFDVPVGPRQRRPDFIVLHPARGVLVLEVKDWRWDTIAELDPDRAVIRTEQGQKVTANPLRQARDYAIEVVSILQTDPILRHPQHTARAGQILVPWGHGVVLTNITRAQFDEAELGHYIRPNQVICRDEMTESIDGEAFQARLWDMFSVSFNCNLSLPQIERIRWHLFPQLRIGEPTQSRLFDIEGKAAPQQLDIPDLIRVMDLQQEQLARSLGNGHRVIHGVAGSGKTMILGYRCLELAKQHEKPVLVLCYNKTLASRLEQMVASHGVIDKVFVRHFHGWCQDQLTAYAIKKPSAQKDAGEYLRQLVDSVIGGVESNAIPRAQYSAVLIDEGHDFEPDWLKLVTQMVDPETNAVLLLYDDAQTIYGGANRRKFSFASVGIQAQGRTTILRLNYRNTLEVLMTAKLFANELLTAQEADEDHVPVVAPESAGRRGDVPEIIDATSIWHEAKIIAQRVSDALSDGADANDFAVLCRRKALADLVTRELMKRQLPVRLMTEGNKRSLFEGPPAVTVMTMHSSKGLEFETVFLPGLCEIGSSHALSADELRQEAKLIYVAMTRALSGLVMLHHTTTEVTERLTSAVKEVRRRLVA